MTEINGYRDGTQSSTELLQRAMEESHSVENGEGKALKWIPDHESWDAGRTRVHDESGKGAIAAGKFLLDLSGIESSARKALIKSIPDILENPKVAIVALVESGVTSVTSVASRVVVADGSIGVAGFAGAAAAVAIPVKAMLDGDDLKTLSDLDAMDLASTALLDLDPSFKATDMAKHPGINPQKLMAFMNDSPAGKEYKAELQTAADEGMRCALDAIRCGGPSEYARLHPDVASRRNGDIAFNKGFESTLYAASQHDGASRVDTIKAGLDARDARSAVNHTIRG